MITNLVQRGLHINKGNAFTLHTGRCNQSLTSHQLSWQDTCPAHPATACATVRHGDLQTCLAGRVAAQTEAEAETAPSVWCCLDNTHAPTTPTAWLASCSPLALSHLGWSGDHTREINFTLQTKKAYQSMLNFPLCGASLFPQVALVLNTAAGSSATEPPLATHLPQLIGE
ncbi:hypothetical protein E2C01_048341 [Portunus trituberculatus]|uniref:Uncharacterized protein n=1 Tax=Portunus trituberculatus TaxID=210409 RepID=A0A5B7GAQ7_PORTR|nr:hypothetical protein [Portunus trituberculatus]